MRVLITGASGNVGSVVLKRLLHSSLDLHVGVRDVGRVTKILRTDRVDYCQLDFEKEQYPDIEFDAVFLVRPPQLADPRLFENFLRTLRPDTRIVFLSVLGADTKAYLPHAKIEQVILKLGLPHVFIRPSYFMENLTTTLWEELEKNNRIFLPAGDLKLNWVAIQDIAEIAAKALKGDIGDISVEVCGPEMLGFAEVVDLINAACGTHVVYESPSLFRYLGHCLMQRETLSYIFVMLMLHYLPRFSRGETPVSHDFERITRKPPKCVESFVAEHKHVFNKLI